MGGMARMGFRDCVERGDHVAVVDWHHPNCFYKIE